MASWMEGPSVRLVFLGAGISLAEAHLWTIVTRRYFLFVASPRTGQGTRIEAPDLWRLVPHCSGLPQRLAAAVLSRQVSSANSNAFGRYVSMRSEAQSAVETKLARRLEC